MDTLSVFDHSRWQPPIRRSARLNALACDDGTPDLLVRHVCVPRLTFPCVPRLTP
jgi:hypothetical protein